MHQAGTNMRSCTPRRGGELLAVPPKILLHARSLTKCNLGEGRMAGTAYSLLAEVPRTRYGKIKHETRTVRAPVLEGLIH